VCLAGISIGATCSSDAKPLLCRRLPALVCQIYGVENRRFFIEILPVNLILDRHKPECLPPRLDRSRIGLASPGQTPPASHGRSACARRRACRCRDKSDSAWFADLGLVTSRSLFPGEKLIDRDAVKFTDLLDTNPTIAYGLNNGSLTPNRPALMGLRRLNRAQFLHHFGSAPVATQDEETRRQLPYRQRSFKNPLADRAVVGGDRFWGAPVPVNRHPIHLGSMHSRHAQIRRITNRFVPSAVRGQF
jgi:hypothetical protein